MAAESYREPTRATRSTAAAGTTGSMATTATTSCLAGPETTTCSGAPAATCLRQDGDDVLDGGAGSDRLTGDSGRDIFVVTPAEHDHGGGAPSFSRLLPEPGGDSSGRDVIEDFTRGEDRIDLTAFHSSFAALTGHDERGHDGHGREGPAVTLHSEEHDSVLTFTGGSVRVEGVAHLSADDFIF
jgi:hypothetical protein